MFFSEVLTVFSDSDVMLLSKGLTLLKMRVAAWRYQRGSRSLAANLTAARPLPMNPVPQKEDEMNEDFEIPDDIEEVIEELLQGLRDSRTIVR
jgi:type II secretory pathway component PulC